MKLGEEAFPQIIQNIKWARNLGQLVDLSCVVVRDNLEEIPALLKLAEELDCHGVYLRTLIPGDYYASMFPNKAELGCAASMEPSALRRACRCRSAALAHTCVKVYGSPDQWGGKAAKRKSPSQYDIRGIARFATLRSTDCLLQR